MKKLGIILILLSLLTGCKAKTVTSVTSAAAPVPETVDPETLFSQRDYEADYNASECTALILSGTGTVTIQEAGSYLLSGELSDGTLLIDAPKDSKIRLILNGVTIRSSTNAPIYIRQADKVFMTLAAGSSNTLEAGESFVAIDDNSIDAAIFSKEDLTLNGSGSLTVLSPAGHGIVSKDDLRITGGTYCITAAGHGLSGKDAVSICDGSFTVTSGKDGIQADNGEDNTLGNVYLGEGTYQITADGDGISASGSLYLQAGSYTLLCGGGSENGEEHAEDMPGGMGGFGGPGGRPGGRSIDATTAITTDSVSAKGLKAAGTLTVMGGTLQINSADDAVHSNSTLAVAGGSFQIATGDDGFHADDALNITAGTIVITESYEGLEGLSITVAGGEITLKASDDGLNAAGGNDQSGFGGRPGGYGGDQFAASADSFILISGGTLFVDADGDGIDSNGNLTVSGGNIVVEGPTESMNGPLDYNGNGEISGGTVVITGSSGMAQSLKSTGNQGVFAIRCGNCAAGTGFTLTDDTGKEILSVAPQKAYSSIVVSTTDIQTGKSYTVTINGESSTFQAQ